MGSIISGILGTNNDFKADTGGQNFGNAIAQQQQALGNAQAGQMSLAQALQQQSAGVGANPAQNMLNQATDKNIKQNAGMIASQKSINPALAQRLIAQNAAQASQEAAGQGALMGAQQQLSAQNQLGNVYNQMGGLANQAQGISQTALGNANQINSGVASANAQNNAGIMGGLLGAGATLLAGPLGGAAASALGGSGSPSMPSSSSFQMPKLGSSAGFSNGGKIDGQAPVQGDHPANDTVPAMLSPGEIVVPRSKASNPKLAKQFIDQVMSGKTQETQSGDEVTYADVLAMQKQLHSMIAKLKG